MTKKITLKNGVRLIYQHIEHVRSVSAGIWVDCGSKNENPENSGISHLIEHMMFKGSNMRTSAQLAHDMDMLGAMMNAFTSKESTCYHVKCLDSDLYSALDILSEMFLHPKMDEAALEQEKRVVIEEIGMYIDTPEDVATEELTINAFAPHPCSMPILGTVETVSKITRDDILEYMDKHYIAENILISVAGSFDEEKLVSYIENIFGDVKSGTSSSVPTDITFSGGECFFERDIAQNHLCIGWESVGRKDPRSYALSVMSLILGDGMSSRLYQKLREQSGLCYSVYSFNMPVHNTGMFVIGAAYSPESHGEIMRQIDEVIADFSKNGASNDEFIRAKKQIITSVIMSFESSSSRMPYIARGELIFGRVRTMDELISLIENITLEDVNALAHEIFSRDRRICIVGPKADTSFGG